jgi:hypothetical protein
MKTLIESLYTNNVLFAYYGFVDDKVMKHVVEITRTRLVDNNESETTIDHVHEAIHECVDNIIRHNFFPDDSRMHYKSLIVVSKQQDHYEVNAINVINTDQKNIIHKQLEALNKKTKSELLELKYHGSASEKQSAGLIDLVLKSDTCGCTFKDLPVNHLFKINYRINCLN